MFTYGPLSATGQELLLRVSVPWHYVQTRRALASQESRRAEALGADARKQTWCFQTGGLQHGAETLQSALRPANDSTLCRSFTLSVVAIEHLALNGISAGCVLVGHMDTTPSLPGKIYSHLGMGGGQ